MSKEVELPGLDVTDKDLEDAEVFAANTTDHRSEFVVERAERLSRERQLRAALTQVATLRDAFIRTGRNLGAFLTDEVSNEFICDGLPEEARLVMERMNAELAALREGFVTTFEVDWSYATSPNLENCMVFRTEYDLRRW